MSSGLTHRNTSVFKDPVDGLYKTRVDGEINVIADIENSTTSKIYNKTAATAGTEYSQLLTTGTKKIIIKVRATKTKLKYSFVAGESGTKFITVGKNSSREINGLDLTSKTIYFQTNKDNQTVEIEEWS